MSDTLFASFSPTLKRTTLETISRQLGESEQAVSRGFELSAAGVFGELTRRTGDTNALHEIIDLASKTPANVLSSALSADQLTNSNSPLISGGKRFLSSLSGSGLDAILNSVSRESGLRSASASIVLTLAAQSVLSFIGTLVRDQGMTANTLGGFLQNEGASHRDSLDAGFHEPFTTPAAELRASSPVIAQTIETNPVIAQTVRKERSFLLWLVPLALILLGLFWLFSQPHRSPVAETPVATPAPAKITPPATATLDLGNFVSRQLVDGTTLNIPERGVEGSLLEFIQNSNRTPDKTTWFDFDRLLFDTGSATLQPQSGEQLHNIAAILKAYPNVHLKIGGYTDNVGSADQNMKLSQARAVNVMDELVHLGVAPGRLTAQGYGEEHAVADNSTEAGRALNRRISMLVTQK
jgi:OmpA-OmpF porin, OOP family